MIYILMIWNIFYFLFLTIYTKQINLFYFILTILNILIYILNVPVLNELFMVLLLIIIINCLVLYIKGKQVPEGNSEVMVILGYVLYHDQIQPLLYNRLDTAYEYYLKHPEILIVVTGGITKGNSISEGAIMKKYLIQKGIPANQIYEEDQAEDTYANLINCEKYVRNQNQYIILVTNRFHMKRALMIAYKAGYTKMQGLSAPDNLEFLSSYLREFFALIYLRKNQKI